MSEASMPPNLLFQAQNVALLIVLTTYVLGSPARFDRLQDCDDLVFRKP